MRIVQDHAPERPFGGADVVDLLPADREMMRCCRADERGDLARSRVGLVGRAFDRGCGMNRDAAAPGIGRLCAFSVVGIWDCVACRYVHEDEWIERDLVSARLEVV